MHASTFLPLLLAILPLTLAHPLALRDANLGGIAAPPVINIGGDRPFSVQGNTFVNESAAVERSCAIQNNACADKANSNRNAGFSVADCQAQQQKCEAGKPATSAASPASPTATADAAEECEA